MRYLWLEMFPPEGKCINMEEEWLKGKMVKNTTINLSFTWNRNKKKLKNQFFLRF